MAYDEGIAERLRELFARRPGVTEKKMFGGLAFMYRDHMLVGIIGECVDGTCWTGCLRRSFEAPLYAGNGFHRQTDERLRLRCPGWIRVG